MPPPAKLRQLCHEIGSSRCGKVLARELGFGVYDEVPAEEATPLDEIEAAAQVLGEVGAAVHSIMKRIRSNGGKVTTLEYLDAAKRLHEGTTAIELLDGMLRARVVGGQGQ